VPPMVNWLRRHWVTSATPWTGRRAAAARTQTVWRWPVLGLVGLVSTIGPLVFIFSKGLERASAQAFFRLYKRVGPEGTSIQAKFFN
jgi:hypothetical protein